MPTPKKCTNFAPTKSFAARITFLPLHFPSSAGAAQRWIFRDPFRGKGETLGFGRERGNFHEEAEEKKKEEELWGEFTAAGG